MFCGNKTLSSLKKKVIRLKVIVCAVRFVLERP